MFKILLRELYLLPRGEQRALVAVTLLLLISLMARVGVEVMPGREPAGVEEFTREAEALMLAFARADSALQAKEDSLEHIRTRRYDRSAFVDSHQTSTRQFLPIDINRADSAQLLPLPGIGPVFAGRIVKYRNLLGGYLSADQLSEVYGMPSETVDRISNKILIDSSAVRKIPIDSASFGELLRHPYLEYEEVKALVEYRDFKGKVSSLKELETNQILSDTTLKRIHGYFDYR